MAMLMAYETMNIRYFHRPSLLTPEHDPVHRRICELLDQLRATGMNCTTENADEQFPDSATQAAFLEQIDLRGFAMRRKAGLSQTFGSRRAGFWWLPPQFVLVFERDELVQVFPCGIGQEDVTPLHYLEHIAAGKPWTYRSGKGMEGRKHKLLVDRLKADSAIIERGLTLQGSDVQVSQGIEVGFIDLVFEDSNGRPLLVEVKVDGDEMDKAVGQILRHRYLYAVQNRIPKSEIRLGICCQYVPPSFCDICNDLGITWVEVALGESHSLGAATI